MAVVKIPRAIIEVLGAPVNGIYPITGYEVERHLTWEGEGAEFFTPRIVREEATALEVQTLRDASAETLTGQLQNLNALNASLQGQVDTLTIKHAAAVNALRAVADADTSWDVSPRAQVIQVLQAEGL